MARNPFKPTAGARPPVLVGRDAPLDEFGEAILDGPGAPGRLVRVIGNRGVGKTVLLTAMGDRAREAGWFVVDETASDGFAERLVGAIDPDEAMVLESIGLPGGLSATWKRVQLPRTLRSAIGSRLASKARRRSPKGVLITVDEIQAAHPDDLRAVATAAQHCIREGLDIAVIFGGLVDPAVDKALTFLIRAQQLSLGDVALPEVADAFRVVIEDSGKTITGDALDAATAETGGYPFMIQLVGHEIWRCAEGDVVTMAAAVEGCRRARTRLGAMVHEPTIHGLSDVERTFLVAMAHDEGPSRVGILAKRLGRSPQYANKYRETLMRKGVVISPRRGELDFAVPGLREWLRQHAASLRVSQIDTEIG